MSIKVLSEINYCSNDDADYPGYLVVEITRELINKMKPIAQFVKENDLRHAKGSYNFSDIIPTFYDTVDDLEENKESEHTIRSCAFIINDTDMYIEASMKYSGDTIECDSFRYTYLEELLDISEMPIEHMGKYINDDDENIRNIAKERLAEQNT